MSQNNSNNDAMDVDSINNKSENDDAESTNNNNIQNGKSPASPKMSEVEEPSPSKNDSPNNKDNKNDANDDNSKMNNNNSNNKSSPNNNKTSNKLALREKLKQKIISHKKTVSNGCGDWQCTNPYCQSNIDNKIRHLTQKEQSQLALKMVKLKVKNCKSYNKRQFNGQNGGAITNMVGPTLNASQSMKLNDDNNNNYCSDDKAQIEMVNQNLSNNDHVSDDKLTNVPHLTRENTKQFICSEPGCNHRFSHSSNLKIHSIVHSNNAFVCHLCGKRFARKANKRQHLRVHTGERPFKCDMCGKCFRMKSSLKDHRLTHSGEKPFECRVCHRRFTEISNLYAHRKNVHSFVK